MLKKLKAEKVDKDKIIKEYINEYIKLLPITDDKLITPIIHNENVLKQEPDIYIIESNECMEE